MGIHLLGQLFHIIGKSGDYAVHLAVYWAACQVHLNDTREKFLTTNWLIIFFPISTFIDTCKTLFVLVINSSNLNISFLTSDLLSLIIIPLN